MRSAAPVWAAGRLDGGAGPSGLLFGRMHEDSAIELRLFPPGGRIFCIASAGCMARALAPRHKVTAVDINPVQLDYARGRFEGGAFQPGAADRLMKLARALAPLAGWTRAAVGEFLNLDDPAEQALYWRRRLDTRRFRAALGALLWPPLLRRVYAGPLVDCLPRDFGEVLRRRLERGIARHPNRTNPHARALFLGETREEMPAGTAGRIRWEAADAADYLEAQPPGSFDGFTVSNIMDGAGAAYRRRLEAAARRAAAPGAVMVRRSFAEPSEGLRGNLAAEDRSMIWGVVEAVRAADL